MKASAWVVLLIAMGSFGCAQKMVQTPPVAKDMPPPRGTTPEPSTKITRDAPKDRNPEFQPVFFDYDSFTLRADARAALDRNAEAMRKTPDLDVTIEGHCDERGTIEYNMALGEKRANRARDYLVANGIPASRIRTVSFGKERPFAAGNHERAWSQNRRAHTVVVTKDLSSR